jgi:hypothetical protein
MPFTLVLAFLQALLVCSAVLRCPELFFSLCLLPFGFSFVSCFFWRFFHCQASATSVISRDLFNAFNGHYRSSSRSFLPFANRKWSKEGKLRIGKVKERVEPFCSQRFTFTHVGRLTEDIPPEWAVETGEKRGKEKQLNEKGEKTTKRHEKSGTKTLFEREFARHKQKLIGRKAKVGQSSNGPETFRNKQCNLKDDTEKQKHEENLILLIGFCIGIVDAQELSWEEIHSVEKKRNVEHMKILHVGLVTIFSRGRTEGDDISKCTHYTERLDAETPCATRWKLPIRYK